MARVCSGVLGGMLGCGVLVFAQTAQFEVASVKPAVRPFGYIHRCPETRLIALKAPRYG